MSTRFEYVDPRYCGPAFVNELDLAEENAIEDPHDEDVLVLWYDEAIVIPGSAEEIIAFAERIIDTVKKNTADGRAKRMPRCEICKHPLEADGTCSYREMDEADGLDHKTGDVRE